MSRQVLLRNRQRTRAVNRLLLGRITRVLLTEFFRPPRCHLCVHLVGKEEISRLNQEFLRHAGATDVITFNYAQATQADALCGEVFICLDEALAQARRFRTTWQAELVRYLVHGVLHLRGYDDGHPRARRKMRREENRLLRALAKQFALRKLAKSS